MTNQIAKHLDELAKARLERDELADEIEAMINSVIPPEVQERIDAIRAELAPNMDSLNETISNMESNIKERVLLVGETVKGSVLQAVYNKGRTSWDNKALDGYAKAHPELLEFRSEGKPYVSIR